MRKPKAAHSLVVTKQLFATVSKSDCVIVAIVRLTASLGKIGHGVNAEKKGLQTYFSL
jgi:hypothetical protein